MTTISPPSPLAASMVSAMRSASLRVRMRMLSGIGGAGVESLGPGAVMTRKLEDGSDRRNEAPSRLCLRLGVTPRHAQDRPQASPVDSRGLPDRALADRRLVLARRYP